MEYTPNLLKVEVCMDSTQYQQILKNNVQKSVKRLKLSPIWLFQKDNHPKQTKEFMHRNNVLELPTQSPDLNNSKKLWNDYKWAVNALQPTWLN